VKEKKAVQQPYHKHSKKIGAKPSKGEPVIADSLSKKLRISEDILAKAPIVMGYGSHRFCVENYRNIIEYTQELVRIQTKTGRIHIVGKNLVIAYFRDDSMCVMGDISSVEYH
jgi:sporulation protein YqfC